MSICHLSPASRSFSFTVSGDSSTYTSIMKIIASSRDFQTNFINHYFCKLFIDFPESILETWWDPISFSSFERIECKVEKTQEIEPKLQTIDNELEMGCVPKSGTSDSWEKGWIDPRYTYRPFGLLPHGFFGHPTGLVGPTRLELACNCWSGELGDAMCSWIKQIIKRKGQIGKQPTPWKCGLASESGGATLVERLLRAQGWIAYSLESEGNSEKS